MRGVPLGDRADAVAERFARLHGVAGIPELERRWADGLAAPRWSGPPLWIHGDLHPGNLVVRGGELVGLIDFGDVTAGDPAYDLAAAWLAFDDHGRREFLGALDGRYDEATWQRAHAWAGAVTAMLLDASDDNPPYSLLGRECLAELAGG